MSEDACEEREQQPLDLSAKSQVEGIKKEGGIAISTPPPANPLFPSYERAVHSSVPLDTKVTSTRYVRCHLLPPFLQYTLIFFVYGFMKVPFLSPPLSLSFPQLLSFPSDFFFPSSPFFFLSVPPFHFSILFLPVELLPFSFGPLYCLFLIPFYPV